jgi:hypothetical protein
MGMLDSMKEEGFEVLSSMGKAEDQDTMEEDFTFQTWVLTPWQALTARCIRRNECDELELPGA